MIYTICDFLMRIWPWQDWTRTQLKYSKWTSQTQLLSKKKNTLKNTVRLHLKLSRQCSNTQISSKSDQITSLCVYWIWLPLINSHLEIDLLIQLNTYEHVLVFYVRCNCQIQQTPMLYNRSTWHLSLIYKGHLTRFIS